MAIVYARASLHTVDRYFMQLRRLLMALERPIHTPSNDGRVWRGYSHYNPARIQQLLDIYRIYYNFVKKGEDGFTPAMRLGLAKGVIRIEDILYFDGPRSLAGSPNVRRRRDHEDHALLSHDGPGRLPSTNTRASGIAR